MMTFIRHFPWIVSAFRSRPAPIFLEFYLPLFLGSSDVAHYIIRLYVIESATIPYVSTSLILQ